MNVLEQALVDLARTEGASEQVKIFATRALLQERRDLKFERRMTRLLWLLAVVGVANLISAAMQAARMAVCP